MPRGLSGGVPPERVSSSARISIATACILLRRRVERVARSRGFMILVSVLVPARPSMVCKVVLMDGSPTSGRLPTPKLAGDNAAAAGVGGIGSVERAGGVRGVGLSRPCEFQSVI